MSSLKNDGVVDELQTCPFLKVSELMDLCVTENRGITCRYYIGPSLRIKEYIVTPPVTMISFSRIYIFSFINKGP